MVTSHSISTRPLTPQDIFDLMNLGSDEERQCFVPYTAPQRPLQQPVFTFPLSSNSTPPPTGVIADAQLEGNPGRSPA